MAGAETGSMSEPGTGTRGPSRERAPARAVGTGAGVGTGQRPGEERVLGPSLGRGGACGCRGGKPSPGPERSWAKPAGQRGPAHPEGGAESARVPPRAREPGVRRGAQLSRLGSLPLFLTPRNVPVRDQVRALGAAQPGDRPHLHWGDADLPRHRFCFPEPKNASPAPCHSEPKGGLPERPQSEKSRVLPATPCSADISPAVG